MSDLGNLNLSEEPLRAAAPRRVSSRVVTVQDRERLFGRCLEGEERRAFGDEFDGRGPGSVDEMS